MHQSMQIGSMARAASTAPMSSASQPNWSRIWLSADDDLVPVLQESRRERLPDDA